MADKKIELTPFEARFVEVIRQNYTGKNHAVPSIILEDTFNIRGSTIRKTVNILRAKGIPICSCNGGYFYPASAEECRETVGYLTHRINSVLVAAKGVEEGYNLLDKGIDPADLITVGPAPTPPTPTTP